MPHDGDILICGVLASDIVHQANGIATRGQVVDLDQLLLIQVELLAQNLRCISCP